MSACLYRLEMSNILDISSLRDKRLADPFSHSVFGFLHGF
ncbi:hypothetical protein T4D_14014 [Trichinella pseudospiralis]|uniref:Uncharacterized protein n=1 Tax=Trichinella pseudospiralis TaxID=6337 RepID=A0A0V1DP56_TRIPS|nr:hypothetical protein T4D_14014 [Trichinella pseudospiralis]